MKTTIEIDDDLLRRAKRIALERDTTLRAIIEEALSRALGPARPASPLRVVVWPAEEMPGEPVSGAVVRDAVARERADPADDPPRLVRRSGVDMRRPQRKR